MPAKFVQLLKGTGGKKFKAVFYDSMRKKISSTSFGAVGYNDFTITNDIQAKINYISRHQSREDFNKFMSAGALSRWILWEKPTLSGAYKAYRQRFGLELF